MAGRRLNVILTVILSAVTAGQVFFESPDNPRAAPYYKKPINREYSSGQQFRSKPNFGQGSFYNPSFNSAPSFSSGSSYTSPSGFNQFNSPKPFNSPSYNSMNSPSFQSTPSFNSPFNSAPYSSFGSGYKQESFGPSFQRQPSFYQPTSSFRPSGYNSDYGNGASSFQTFKFGFGDSQLRPYF